MTCLDYGSLWLQLPNLRFSFSKAPVINSNSAQMGKIVGARSVRLCLERRWLYKELERGHELPRQHHEVPQIKAGSLRSPAAYFVSQLVSSGTARSHVHLIHEASRLIVRTLTRSVRSQTCYY